MKKLLVRSTAHKDSTPYSYSVLHIASCRLLYLTLYLGACMEQKHGAAAGAQCNRTVALCTKYDRAVETGDGDDTGEWRLENGDGRGEETLLMDI